MTRCSSCRTHLNRAVIIGCECQSRAHTGDIGQNEKPLLQPISGASTNNPTSGTSRKSTVTRDNKIEIYQWMITGLSKRRSSSITYSSYNVFSLQTPHNFLVLPLFDTYHFHDYSVQLNLNLLIFLSKASNLNYEENSSNYVWMRVDINRAYR